MLTHYSIQLPLKPSLVEMERIELSISGCKPDVFPLALHPLIVVWEARIELAPRVSKTRRLPLSYTQIILVPPL